MLLTTAPAQISDLVKQIMAGQIDWVLVTPERIQACALASFSSADFSQCTDARALSAFLHSFENEFMQRKYVLLISQHMKLINSEFSETYLSVKRQFDQMMEKLSRDKQFMDTLASL